MAPLPAEERYDFCSVYSQEAADEPLHATATRADIWLSLEYVGRWGARAFPESDLPPTVKEHVSHFESAVARVRTQFIRRPENYRPEPIHFFVSVSNARLPRLYRFELQSYKGLLDLDLEAIVAGRPDYDGHLSSQQLFLVCNNGLRDACCAKFGIAVMKAVGAAAGADGWQCTHIGGQRLAPNLLFLPHALSYGRASAADAAMLVESYRRGEVYLPRLRGRTIYDRPEQAAEQFLREERGIMGVDDVYVRFSTETGKGRWQVEVVYAGGEQAEVVTVEARTWPVPVYDKCTSTERVEVKHYFRAGSER
jgi:hypothetical protein